MTIFRSLCSPCIMCLLVTFLLPTIMSEEGQLSALQRVERNLVAAVRGTQQQQQIHGSTRSAQMVQGLFRATENKARQANLFSEEDISGLTVHTVLLGRQDSGLMTLDHSLFWNLDDDLNSIRGEGFDSTGVGLWASGLLLQAFLASNQGRTFIQGKRCVELGTGTGAVSIAAARLGATHVLATDGNPVMVALADLNAHRNLDVTEINRWGAAEYLWGGPEPENIASGFQFETVLLTDLLYSDAKIESLVAGVEAVCAVESCDVLVAYEQRDGIIIRHENGTLEFSAKAYEDTEYYQFFRSLKVAGFTMFNNTHHVARLATEYLQHNKVVWSGVIDKVQLMHARRIAPSEQHPTSPAQSTSADESTLSMTANHVSTVDAAEQRLVAALKLSFETQTSNVNNDEFNRIWDEQDKQILQWQRNEISIPSLGNAPAVLTTISSMLELFLDMQSRLSHGAIQGGYDSTGGKLWASGLLLQAFLASNQGRTFIQGKRCVELGTGTGAVSIAAARLGATHVLATDGNPVMVALADLNAHRNLDVTEINRWGAAEYLWGGPEPENIASGFQFETVLLTDLLYSDAKIEPLVAGVEAVCAVESCDVLVAYEQRHAESSPNLQASSTEYSQFFSSMEAIGFNLTTGLHYDGMTTLIDAVDADKQYSNDEQMSLQGTMANVMLVHAARRVSPELPTTFVEQSEITKSVTSTDFEHPAMELSPEQLQQLAEIIGSTIAKPRPLHHHLTFVDHKEDL